MLDQLKPLLDLAHQYLPADLWNKGVMALGYVGLFGQIVPLLLSWGVPAAGRAADAVARFLLATPLRPLILYFLPYIVKFLDSLTAALDLIAETFKKKLEEDLEGAARADAAKAAPPSPSSAAPAASSDAVVAAPQAAAAPNSPPPASTN